MSWASVGLGAASVLGGLFGSNKASNAASDSARMQADAAIKAAQIQADAATKASQQQQEAIKGATAVQQPYMQAGQPALNTLVSGFADGGQFTTPFTMADAANSEAAKFALQQGTEAIQNSAAARGGLLGTNTLQDLTKFGQSNAALYEDQAFRQWLAQRQQHVAGLSGLADTGIEAANRTSNLMIGGGNAAAQGTLGAANAMAGGYTSAANANAAGTVGAANATNSGFSNIINQFSMLSGLFNPAGSTPAPAPAPAYNPATIGQWTPPNYSLTGP